MGSRAGCTFRSPEERDEEVPMFKKSMTLVLLATVATAVAWAVPAALGQDAKTILSNASKAMGADNLKTVQYSGTATEFAFGQAVNPSSPWPGFAETSYTRTINYESPAWRVDRVLAAIPSNRRGGGKFPSGIVQKQGGYPTLDLTVTDVKPNSPVNIQGNPAGAPQTPPATSQKLADGVYLILPAYAALAVDFKDYVVVIEGPQSEERANAIITEAKRLIPNKPIKYVVNTHNHFDHLGGLRTFVAEGA